MCRRCDARGLLQMLEKWTTADVPAFDEDGATLLIVAAQQECVECARHLLAYGANVNARCDSGWTALHYAADTDSGVEMVLLLLQHGAIIDAVDKDGNTP